MTRLETFVDAAFAFSLTVLIVSFDEVPETFAQLREALKRIPTFAASFALLMLFWSAHRRWSRRYGLEDGLARILSFTLIFVVLVFVFPLRLVFAGLFHWISGGWLPRGLKDLRPELVGELFVVYGAGFMTLSLVVAGLYWHAFRCRDRLALSDAEMLLTRGAMWTWVAIAAIGATSMGIAALVPRLAGASGFLYFGAGVSAFAVGRRFDPARRAQ